MRGDPRGVVLFALELSLLRAIRNAGGASSPDLANGNWDTAAELCRLNLLSSAGEVLKITPDGEKALRLTAEVPNGRVGFISMERWTESERVQTRDSAQVNEEVQ